MKPQKELRSHQQRPHVTKTLQQGIAATVAAAAGAAAIRRCSLKESQKSGKWREQKTEKKAEEKMHLAPKESSVFLGPFWLSAVANDSCKRTELTQKYLKNASEASFAYEGLVYVLFGIFPFFIVIPPRIPGMSTKSQSGVSAKKLLL